MSAETSTHPVDLDDLPAAPPAEVLAAVDAAWERVSVLEAMNRTLHFAVDADRGLAVEVRTLTGGFVRRVSPSQALDVLHGPAA